MCSFAVVATLLGACTSASPSDDASTPGLVTSSTSPSGRLGDGAEFDGEQYLWVEDQLDWPGITLQVGLYIPADFVADPSGRAGSWLRSDCATKTDGSCPTITLEQYSDMEVADNVALDGTVAASGVSWTVSEVVAESFAPKVQPVVTITLELAESYDDTNATLSPFVETHTFFPIGKGESGDYGQLVVQVSASSDVPDFKAFVDRTTTTAALRFHVISSEEK
ncbi:MAG: hypothetical protein FWF02_14270 [Micrococcales bacterium]|nr:hypothetical protein [Micrococcales bacterium]MCL2668842.1 hypothetical protein [Micrococcales bacterium]